MVKVVTPFGEICPTRICNADFRLFCRYHFLYKCVESGNIPATLLFVVILLLVVVSAYESVFWVSDKAGQDIADVSLRGA